MTAVSLGVIGSVATIAVAMTPRLVVEPPGAASPSDTSTWSFTIQNASALPLSDIRPSIGVCYISPGCEPPQPCFGPLPSNDFFSPEGWRSPRLATDERVTIALGDVLRLRSGAICSADLNVVVRYDLPYVPFSFEKQFRFQLTKVASGALGWRAVPLSRR